MPILFEEKTNRKLENGHKSSFYLSAHSEDFLDEEEGCFLCEIRVTNSEGKLVSEYYRKFLISKFKKQHYYQFIDKFCKDEKYRDQFNIIYDKREEDRHEIDKDIKPIVDKLNEIKLETLYSCSGTRTPFCDRPHFKDGHSVFAYIMFRHKLPNKFIEISKRYDLFLSCSNNYISTVKRSYNNLFIDLIVKIIEQYEKEK